MPLVRKQEFSSFILLLYSPPAFTELLSAPFAPLFSASFRSFIQMNEWFQTFLCCHQLQGSVWWRSVFSHVQTQTSSMLVCLTSCLWLLKSAVSCLKSFSRFKPTVALCLFTFSVPHKQLDQILKGPNWLLSAETCCRKKRLMVCSRTLQHLAVLHLMMPDSGMPHYVMEIKATWIDKRGFIID